MAAQEWLAAARSELDELNAEDTLEGVDAWRALALTGRLAAAGQDHLAANRLSELRSAVDPSPPQELIDALHDALARPPGEPDELLLILVDIDDRSGIEVLVDNVGVARTLTSHAAGLLSLYPTALLELCGFAEMRLECFAQPHPTQAVWGAVVDAAAQCLAQGLPASTATTDPALIARLLGGAERPSWAPVLLPGGREVRPIGRFDPALLRLAASTADRDSYPVHDADGQVIGWVYTSPKTGRPTLEVRLHQAPAQDVILTLIVTTADGEVRATRDIETEIDGTEVYADLAGATPGSAGLLAELVAESALSANEVHIRVAVHV